MFMYDEDEVQPSLLFLSIFLVVLIAFSGVIRSSDFSFSLDYLTNNIISLLFMLFFFLYSLNSSIYFIKRLLILRRNSYRAVNKHLNFLHTHPNLPKNCTIVPVFTIPKILKKEILQTKFSEASLQKMADYMNAYLGLFDSIKITVGVESRDNPPGIPNAIRNESNHAGYYRVGQGENIEIHIIKKKRFRFSHILAILAHELVHHYMYKKNILLCDENENEIFTDISAAYLGLGALLAKGYKPIRWKKFVAGGESINTMTIGYVKPYTVSYAVFQSAILRGKKEFISTASLHFKVLILLNYLRCFLMKNGETV